ncbi:Alpha/beta hydrolase fold-1 [Mariannaea sp. PMI_226]|nr:Alpha/beta hydrolase fold-1 [Mariannaea sp. PMI_226]
MSPHVVIVPASFAPPLLYTDLVKHLSGHGLNTTVVDLPSVGHRDPLPAASMLDDAEHIRAITTKLAEDGHDIVLLMHSYGGICGTESTAGVSKAERQAIGKLGGITHLIYISSPVPEINGSVQTMMGDKMPEFMKLEGDYLISEPNGCASVNFSDLPSAEAIKYAKQMTAHSAVSFAGPLKNAGYLNIPVAYIICEHDVSVPPEFQRSVVDMISAKSGREVLTFFSESGHFPNISAPDKIAAFVNSAAALC